MDTKQAILTRQSIREYDPTFKIDEATLLQLLQEASTAPSSWNLQPWRFVIIQQPELKAKLRPFVFSNTPQLDTSSALILVLNDLDRYAMYPILNQMDLDAGIITQDHFKIRQQKAEQARATRTKESLDREGLLDCGIVAQNIMILARGYGFDTCPMGGFDREQFMKLLEIDSNRYKPVVLISIGKRAKDAKKSFRFPIKTITTIK
jgi:nitroreductase